MWVLVIMHYINGDVEHWLYQWMKDQRKSTFMNVYFRTTWSWFSCFLHTERERIADRC